MRLPDVHVIKPKLEPSEDSPVLAPDAADEWETTPLSGHHPFFTIIMSRSQVQKPFQLVGGSNISKYLIVSKNGLKLSLSCFFFPVHSRSIPQAPPGDAHNRHPHLPWEVMAHELLR